MTDQLIKFFIEHRDKFKKYWTPKFGDWVCDKNGDATIIHQRNLDDGEIQYIKDNYVWLLSTDDMLEILMKKLGLKERKQ